MNTVNSKVKHRIILVLGDGGARASAHLGVLEVLVDHSLVPNCLVGTGFGAYIAAAYAAVPSIEKVKTFYNSLPSKYFFEPNYTNAVGLYTVDALIEAWFEFTKCYKFESLQIPLSIVISELISGTSHVIRNGDILLALRKTLAWPGIYTVVLEQNEIFCAGAETNPLPLDVGRSMSPDVLIASDTESQHKRTYPTRSSTLSPWLNALTQVLPPIKWFKRQRILTLLFRGLEMMHTTSIMWSIRKYQPDIIIRLESDDDQSKEIKVDDFHKREEISNLGRERAVISLEYWQSQRYR